MNIQLNSALFWTKTGTSYGMSTPLTQRHLKMGTLLLFIVIRGVVIRVQDVLPLVCNQGRHSRLTTQIKHLHARATWQWRTMWRRCDVLQSARNIPKIRGCRKQLTQRQQLERTRGSEGVDHRSGELDQPPSNKKSKLFIVTLFHCLQRTPHNVYRMSRQTVIPLFTLQNGTTMPLCCSVQVKKKVRRQSFDTAALRNLYVEMVTEKKRFMWCSLKGEKQETQTKTRADCRWHGSQLTLEVQQECYSKQ